MIGTVRRGTFAATIIGLGVAGVAQQAALAGLVQVDSGSVEFKAANPARA